MYTNVIAYQVTEKMAKELKEEGFNIEDYDIHVGDWVLYDKDNDTLVTVNDETFKEIIEYLSVD